MGKSVLKPIMYLIAVIVIASVSTASIAQNTVRGRVTNSVDGSALVAASVQIKETNTGVQTNDHGDFEITIQPGRTLVF